jgi:hypothetical protein
VAHPAEDGHLLVVRALGEGRVEERDVDLRHGAGERAVATAIALYGPGSGAALATVVGVLVEVPAMLSVCRFCVGTREWFEPAVPAVREKGIA